MSKSKKDVDGKSSTPDGERLTTVEHWDSAYQAPIRMRLPSPLLASTGDSRREFRKWVKPGDKVLEIGFAPGKQLAWIAQALGASVSGIDFSAPGVRSSEQLFRHLGLKGDLRCEDVFATSFPLGTFDVVYSQGVIEHFQDPQAIVRQHFELLRPGGVAVITIPNYGGIYGRLQARLDPENLSIHNTRIMSPEAFAALMPADIAKSVNVRYTGRLTSALVSFERRFPAPLSSALFWGTNAIAHLQPFDMKLVAPRLVCTGIRC
ncbi:MAG: class I SAM-dependent methyltransferase [Gemmatimonadota bacterium]|nr:class I SAM-dependent methyltransferase [Gemmatimonadota bacterium]